MTNANNKPEEKCLYCKAFEYFTQLVNETSTSAEEAFHDAFDYLLEHVLDDITEESFEDGVKFGYTQALKDIGQEITQTIEILESKESHCGDCDCDEGYCKEEDDGTNYKITDEVSLEQKIESVIRGD